MSNTTIQLKKSGATGNTPADLNYGEVAINYADGKLFYKNGVGIKAIQNQDTFSTINVNSSLILASSPTDILNLVAGNNVTLSACTVSKTITINSTASGGGGDGTLAQAAYNTANAAFDEANTKTDFFYQNTTPAVANTGDIWINSDTGFEYTNFGNISNPTWAETGPTGASSNTVHINTLAQAAFDKANNAIPLTGSSSITGNLTPATTNTYYLGSDTNRWHSLYVGPGTIDLGGLRLSNTNGSLTVTTPTGQVVPPTGIDDYARGTANNASSNTVALQAVNTTQNTNITSINTFAGAAFTKANNALANTSGTLAGDLNITGNLRLGTATTTPDKLTIESSNIRLQTASTARLTYLNSTIPYQLGVSGGAAMAFHTVSGVHQEIAFETHNTGNHHREHMRINKDGVVTKPYQPSFYAHGTEQNVTISNGFEFKFNATRHNIGNHYNTSTGRFTAPVAGVYAFSFNFFNNGGSGRVAFKLNNADISGQQNGCSVSSTFLTGSMIIYLSANDYVSVGDWQNLGGLTVWSGHSHFSGALLG